jgi:hypothetical protein
VCDCAAQENHYRWLLPSTLHGLYFEGLHPRDLFCRRTYTYLQHQHELPGSLVFCLSWMLTTRLTFFMNLWQKCHRANLHCCHYTILSRCFLLKRSLDPGEISQSYPEWQLIYLGGSVCTAVKPLVAWAFDSVNHLLCVNVDKLWQTHGNLPENILQSVPGRKSKPSGRSTKLGWKFRGSG